MKNSSFRRSLFAIFAASFFAAGCVAPIKEAPLLSDAQKSYVNMLPREKRIEYFADADCRKEMVAAGYYPLTVSLARPADGAKSFSLAESDAEKSAATRTSELDGLTLGVPAYVRVSLGEGTLELGNLKTSALYTWSFADAAGKSIARGTFRTEAQTPRLLKIDGVPNVRDLGGYQGLGGKRLRQGLIYRTAGLNDNALEKFDDEDKVARVPKVRAELDWRKPIIEACARELSEKPADKTLVPYSLAADWTVFYNDNKNFSDEELAHFAALTDIPEELIGVKAQVLTTDAAGIILLPGKIPYRQSVFMQKFSAPEDGEMQIGIAADWFFSVYINGEKTFDLLRSGNTAGVIDVANQTINIPVKKGENLIVIPHLSGEASRTFACGKPAKHVPYAKMLQWRKELEEKLSKSAVRKSLGQVPGNNRLNDEMKKYIVEDLGVKTDLDLRSDRECFGMKGSPAGDAVRWAHISSSAYAGIQSDDGRKAFAKCFKLFLDEANYPIVFHCIAGQDRTGSLAFVLSALLGVAEEELYLDWEVTGFWNPKTSFSHRQRFDKLVGGFDKWPGATIHERVEAYVLSLGFTAADIENLRGIMIEGYSR